jgi:hypothetical protein
MPEQISKYPDVTLKVLKEAGARCGEGAKQNILTQCPRDQFCALPSGEICVYGIDQIPQMTQIKTEELARIVCPPDEQASIASLPFPDLAVMGTIFMAGLLAGGFWRNRRGRRKSN